MAGGQPRHTGRDVCEVLVPSGKMMNGDGLRDEDERGEHGDGLPSRHNDACDQVKWVRLERSFGANETEISGKVRALPIVIGSKLCSTMIAHATPAHE